MSPATAPAQATEFAKVILLGFGRDDDPLAAIVKRFFEGELVEVQTRERFVSDDVDESTLVVVSYALGMSRGDLRGVLDSRAKKILHLPPGARAPLSPRAALRRCANQGVIDVVQGPEDLARTNDWLADFQDRLENLLHLGQMYVRLRVPQLEPGARAFIATPFARHLRADFERGVAAATSQLGLELLNPRVESEVGQRITEKVASMIRDSKLLIANMRHCDQGFNPNVFWEMGFGQGLESVSVIPFRHVSDGPEPPVDVRDREYLTYETGLDLALQLYWGLKDSVTPANVPFQP